MSLIIVAGMHRSGTSMLTHMLAVSGIYAGEQYDLLEALPDDNSRGYWENKHGVAINDEILGLLGGTWRDVPTLEKDWETGAQFNLLMRRLQGLMAQLNDDAIVFKDPRTSITLPVWRRVFPSAKIIICVRNPLEVIDSLNTGIPEYRDFTFEQACELWQTYYEHILRAVEPSEALWTHYHSFFLDPEQELKRILDYVGVEIDEAKVTEASSIVDATMRHNNIPDLLVYGDYPTPPIAQYYAFLSDLCGPVRKTYSADDRQRLSHVTNYMRTKVVENFTTLDRVKKQLDNQKAAAGELSGSVDQLRSEIQGLHKAHAEQMDTHKSLHEQKLAKLRDDHETEIQEQATQYAAEFDEVIQRLRTEHEQETQAHQARFNESIQRLQAEHNQELLQLRENHQSELQVQGTQYTAEFEDSIQRLKTEYEKELTDVRKKHHGEMGAQETRFNESIQQLQTEHKEELSDIRKKRQQEIQAQEARFDELVQRLITEHEEELAQGKESHRVEMKAQEALFNESLQQVMLENEKELYDIQEMHEEEIQEQQARFDASMAELRSGHEEELASAREKHKEEMQAQQAQFDASIAELRSGHEEELASAREKHKEEMQEQQARFDASIAELRSGHEEELASAREKHEEEMQAQQARFDLATMELRIGHEGKLQEQQARFDLVLMELRSGHEEELTSAREKHEEEMQAQQAEFEVFNQNLQSEYDQKLEKLQSKYEITQNTFEEYFEKYHESSARVEELELNTFNLEDRLTRARSDAQIYQSEWERKRRDLQNIRSTRAWRAVNTFWEVRSNILDRVRGIYHFLVPAAIRRNARDSRQNLLQTEENTPRSALSRTPLPMLITDSGVTEPGKAQSRHVDIICFPVIPWEFRYQRPQQLLTIFASQSHRVFYLRTGFIDAKQPFYHSLAEGIFEVYLPGNPHLNIYADTLTASDVEPALTGFQKLIDEKAIRECVLLVQHPFWAPLAKELRETLKWKVIYDCMDDHSGFEDNADTIEIQELELIQNTDLLIVTSTLLESRFLDAHSNIVKIPNAGDFEHFHHLPPVEESPIRALSKPVIGYYGAIAYWMDVESLTYAARQHPEWTFVLIGHVMGAYIEELEQLHNVSFTGEIAYNDLPGYLTMFDVCTIPFKRIPLTEATHPVKLFEYLASGKPIVSRRLPETEPFADSIWLYDTKEEFVENLEQALKPRTDNEIEKSYQIARENTWQKRYEEMKSVVTGLYGRASIIVLTYHNQEHVTMLIESIQKNTIYPDYEVIFVDNGSDRPLTDYLEQLADQYSGVKVILNGENLGFSRGNNVGIRHATDSEYIVLLNDDTVVSYGWLTGLIRHLQSSDVGMVGPVTNYTGNEAQIDVPYTSINEMNAFAVAYTQEHTGEIFDIKVLAMYCVALRRRTIQQIGLLDEQFEIGMFEDDDYALRLQQVGLRTICAHDVFVHHFGRTSFKKLDDVAYQKIFEENKARFERKWSRKWVPHQYADWSGHP